MAKIYNVFISHSWSYSDAYDKLLEMLDTAPNFQYRDYSVPRDDPVHNAPNVALLYAAIKAKMTFCHVVLVISGVYASYSKWIDREIQLANSDLQKPILAIRPWGNERTSLLVEENADKVVGWNTGSIISGIREIAL